MKLLKTRKADIYAGLMLFFTSILSVVDWFIIPGRSANMDGIVHTITPNLFYQSIKNGEFPVHWIDSFANYGLPLGLIAHQFTTYLTSFTIFVISDPVKAFNIVAFLGFFFSVLFFYIFLRLYFPVIYAFAGALIFNFSSYRILNIFIRGALPEFFAGIFIPLIMIGMYLWIQKKNVYGLFLVCISVAFLVLTHPFMLVISLFLLVPYFIFLLLVNNLFSVKAFSGVYFWKMVGSLVFFGLLGVGISGYFFIPLILEIKYFYYGYAASHLTSGNYLGLVNYFSYKWYYFTDINILPRGFAVNFGLFETLTVIAGVVAALYLVFYKKERSEKTLLLLFAVLSGILIIFFTTKYSDVFYQDIKLLSGIQFPWRLLSVLIFIPPIVLAFIFSTIRSKIIIFIFIFIVSAFGFSQMYGKNYVLYPKSDYLFTPLNLHAVVMNPIWTGVSENYPIEKNKPGIIDGNGRILVKNVKNNSRIYFVHANSPLRMVDYTFYFPGWKAYIDNTETPIEFQDPNYRGVITYQVPQGDHKVLLKFEDTKIRIIGKIVSVISVIMLAALFLIRKKLLMK